MSTESFLTFFSISARLKDLDEETDRRFFNWLNDEFKTFRPGYMFFSQNEDTLNIKYRLLLGNWEGGIRNWELGIGNWELRWVS